VSEYQYYEFLAVDHPLDGAAQEALRRISSRARITTTGFANHYEWGDLKANPADLVARYFDLHVYVANWGSRVFMMRLPAAALDPEAIAPFRVNDGFLEVTRRDDRLILTVALNDREPGDWDDGTQWMGALSPLRAAVLQGDLRMLYLVWLTQLDFEDAVPDDAIEPLPGVAPLDAALTAWAGFLDIDRDLLAAAAETGSAAAEPGEDEVRRLIGALPAARKDALLVRLYHGGEPHLAGVFRREVLTACRADIPPPRRRTAGELRVAAERVRTAREEEEATLRAAAERQKAAEAEAALQKRLAELRERGAAAWQDVEALIELRNATGYVKAVWMLADLGDIATDSGDFAGRLADIRMRHAGKRRFIERLNEAGLR